MYGTDAIAAANGWAMAVAGALIVMAGLSVLSFVISHLHKIADILQKNLDKKSSGVVPTKTDPPPVHTVKPPAFRIDEARESFAPLAAELGEDFDLKNLYEIAAASDLPHIHLSIRSLRESGVIVPSQKGLHRWQG